MSGEDWEPIATAPKSTTVKTLHGRYVKGIYLELYCPDMVSPNAEDMKIGICIGWWEPHMDNDLGCWQGEGDFPLNPSHWRHLRPAPVDGKKRGDP